MLKIFFGELENALYGPVWFQYNYETAWLEDPFVQRMMEDVDDSSYVGGELITSKVLGPIPPERLSGGLKTLISIYKNPDKIYDATSCGPNCAGWLLKMAQNQDYTINLNYLMPFEAEEGFRIKIENEERIVSTAKDYVNSAIHYV